MGAALPNVGSFYTVNGEPAPGYATKYYRNAVDGSITVVSVSAIVTETPNASGMGGANGGSMASGDLQYVDPSAHSSLFGGFSQADADLVFSMTTPCGCGGDAAPGGPAAGGPAGLVIESLPPAGAPDGASATTRYVTPDWMFGKSAAGIPFWMILAAFAALAYLVFKD